MSQKEWLGPNYIRELALVMRHRLKIIEHIMYTRTFVVNETNKKEALLLSPV
jgi:hypothetical protein